MISEGNGTASANSKNKNSKDSEVFNLKKDLMKKTIGQSRASDDNKKIKSNSKENGSAIL